MNCIKYILVILGTILAYLCFKIGMEGAEINKSLLALKECIRALGRKGMLNAMLRNNLLMLNAPCST